MNGKIKVEKKTQKPEYYEQHYLDLFSVPAGMDVKQSEILTMPIEKEVYDQIKGQIARGKTVLTARKPDGDPQMWVIGQPFFSASVRCKKLMADLYVPDGHGGFTNKDPKSKIITIQ